MFQDLLKKQQMGNTSQKEKEMKKEFRKIQRRQRTAECALQKQTVRSLQVPVRIQAVETRVSSLKARRQRQKSSVELTEGSRWPRRCAQSMMDTAQAARCPSPHCWVRRPGGMFLSVWILHRSLTQVRKGPARLRSGSPQGL